MTRTTLIPKTCSIRKPGFLSAKVAVSKKTTVVKEDKVNKIETTTDEMGFQVVRNNMNFSKSNGTDQEMSLLEKFAALEISIKQASKVLKIEL